MNAARTLDRSRPAVLKPRAKPLPRKDLDLDFSRLPAQTKAFKAFKPGCRVALPWGRGCGKSWFLRRMAYLLVAEWDGRLRPKGAPNAGVRIIVLMPTLEQARKVHTHLLLGELDATGEWGFLGAKVNRSSWTITFPGGSWIQFVTAESAQHIRGIRCDVVFVDEADDIDPEMVDSVVDPWFSEPHSLQMMLVAGTPRRGRAGLLYRAFHDWPLIDPTIYFGFHATAFQAPTIVDPAYLAKVRARTPITIFNREWLCDFDSAEGLIFPQFMTGFHVREPPSDVVWDEVLVGADHGYEDPGVLLKIGIIGHGADAVAWVLEELYEQHREPEWWLDNVRLWVEDYPDAKWYADPARADICKSWKSAGARLKPVDKGAGSVEDGVGILQRWLHVHRRFNEAGEVISEAARLYVHPRCVRTIDEFGLYRRKRSKQNTELVLEDIEDKNNHAMDSLRYAIDNRFEAGQSRRRAASAEARQATSE